MRHQAQRFAPLLALVLTACGRPSPDHDTPSAATGIAGQGDFAGVGPLATEVAPAPRPARARRGGGEAETWNAAAIDWQPYEAGLERAKAQHKPVCLVFYADWCPHCSKYSHVFEDPKVVERAHDFVMVRVNADDDTALNHRFAPDGSYVPRTYFLGPDGALDPDIHAPRPKFLYFYDEADPASILGGMTAALKKLVR